MVESAFAKALSAEEEVRITVVRRKDGKKRTLPVWFTLEGPKLQLLPMYGLKTQWFRDVEKDGEMEILAKDEAKRVVPRIVSEPAAVDRVKKRFSKKYGVSDVKKYYPTSEIALEITL